MIFKVIPNSCATHALLSILLNSDNNAVKLTADLTKLKTSTRGMSPEQKGEAIASIPRIADAHNNHARYTINTFMWIIVDLIGGDHIGYMMCQKCKRGLKF